VIETDFPSPEISRAERCDSLAREKLLPPSLARPKLRHFLNPVTGWFRRLEREASHQLSRYVYPRVPGISWVYSAQVDRQLTLSEGDIRIPGLPEGFDGTTVLLITDIHVGAFLSVEALRRAFDRLLTVKPDLILLGGDQTTSHSRELVPYADSFRGLDAPLGVFAVLGNHDHYTRDPMSVRRLLEETGIVVLHNRAVVLERGGGRLVLAGIDDLNHGRPDLDRALAEGRAAGGAGAPVVLLSHNPDIFFEAVRQGVALVLSGHTHGGQVRVPRLPVLVRMSRYRLDEGRYTRNGVELVVSRGLGVTGIPFRFFCPPEAVLVRLRC